VRPAFPVGPAALAPYGWPIYRLHQDLIGLRRRHPWLHTARTRPLHLTNEQLVYETSAEGQRLLVVLNLAGAPADCPAPDAGQLVAGHADLVQPGTAQALARLPPFGWAVLAPADH
ncbi:DUF3459 domain-containing protein, partial [Frankia sp. CpI1-P]